MAQSKRYYNTRKYNNKNFIQASPKAKVVLDFLEYETDIAGFYFVEMDLFFEKTNLTEEEIKQALYELEERKIIFLSDDKEIIWLADYIKTQDNRVLNIKNTAHKGIINRIKQYAFFFSEQKSKLLSIRFLINNKIITIKDWISENY